MDETQHLANRLRRVALFALLDEEELEALARRCRPVQLARDEVLFLRGEPARGFYLVERGRIKLFLDSPSGAEKIVNTVGPGGTFGEAVMFLDQPYPVSTAALGEAELVFVPKEAVDELLERRPDFCRRMLAGMAMRLRVMVRDIEAYSLQTAAQRVIGYLLQSCEHERGEATIELPLPRYVIASRLNLTPETLSRVFHELAQQGVLRSEGRRVVVPDVGRLRDYGGREERR